MKGLQYYLYLTAMLAFLSHCSLTSERSYEDIMEEDRVFYHPGRDFILTAGDTGRDFETAEEVAERTPASEAHSSELRQQSSIRREVEKLEQLQPEFFTEHYGRYKEYFQSESEKAYFLRLTSLEDRERFLVDKGIKRRPAAVVENQYTPQYSWEHKSKSSILSEYGTPAQIESSSEGQERWHYPLPDGSVRSFYFQGDKVDGHAHDRR
jgi:hypothetical protein